MISSVLVKPASADCNLACSYCFYREKTRLYPETAVHRMSDEVLDSLVRQVMALEAPVATFGWQGGEPMLMGLLFFEHVVELQQRYGHPGQLVANALQTNGLLLDDRWARFLAKYNFLVGLSLDGPSAIHDIYRTTAKGRPSHERAECAIPILRRHDVEFNALAVLTAESVTEPDTLYRYFVGRGINCLQFIPCAELGPDGSLEPFGIRPEQYGKFLCRLFDLWWNDGQPAVYIRAFDELLIRYVRGEYPSCVFKELCGDYVVVEYNGDIYPCDFFVEPEWRLGNLLERPLVELVRSPRFRQFRERKRHLAKVCRKCRWRDFCHGGCPKYRLINGGREDSPNYFCSAYKRLFAYSSKRMRQMARRIRIQRARRSRV